VTGVQLTRDFGESVPVRRRDIEPELNRAETIGSVGVGGR